MSESVQQEILKPFTQADSSTARKFGGTGLGMSIVNALVSLMNGQFTIQSEEGKGTVMTVILPLEVSDEEVDYLTPTSVEFSSIKALVVDDNQIALETMQRTLQGFGCKVECASDGESAIALTLEAIEATQPFNIAFIDWRMPSIDGLQAIKSIKEKAGDKAPVIILETAYGREILAQNDNIAWDGIIVKPILASDLYNAVVTHCSKAIDWHEHKSEAVSIVQEKALQGLNILVAEDNAVNQMVMNSILTNLGASVTIAGNGQIAIDEVENGLTSFDLILMDMQMPVMDGLEAARVLKQTNIPIVALTANAMKQERDMCFEAGMSDYLTKPIDTPLMISVIHKWTKKESQAQ